METELNFEKGTDRKVSEPVKIPAIGKANENSKFDDVIPESPLSALVSKLMLNPLTNSRNSLTIRFYYSLLHLCPVPHQ